MAFKIGFHTGPGGNPTGIGDYFQRLDAAGIPAVVKSTDHYGMCYELAEIARKSGVAHVVAFRLTTHGQNDGYQYDVPQYHLAPAEAARIHWQATVAKLPPEFDKERVWLEPINEVDKNRANWLGSFALEIAELAMDDGYKLALFGWSSGEPEPEQWEQPAMLDYLRLCYDFPDRLAVSLHEYSYDDTGMDSAYPHQVGRFEWLFDICDKRQIGRPTVLVTEFGWSYNNIPGRDTAMKNIEWAARLYEQHPQVLGAAIWYLGGGFGDIHNKVQGLIRPVADMALAWQPVEPPPLPEPPPPPPGKTLEDHLWARSIEVQTISLNPKAALQAAIYKKGYMPVGSETWTEYGGKQYALQPAEELTGKPRLVAVAEVPKWNEVWFVSDPVAIPPPSSFKLSAWPGQDTRITQTFGANPADYAQFGLPGHDGVDIAASLGDPVKAAAAGEVYRVHRLSVDGWSNYGNHIRVQHIDGFKTIYAHLSAVGNGIKVGVMVSPGQLIGAAGDSGNANGIHLHFGMKRPPGDPGWPFDLIDPTPFLGSLLSDPAVGLDMGRYFLPAAGNFGPIYILTNNWGQGPERVQLQRDGDFSYVVKNQQWEKRLVGATHIDLVMDTSPGGGQLYKVEGHWLPRRMAVGQSFTRTEKVSWFWKDGCRPVAEKPPATMTSRLELVDHNDYWSRNGIGFGNVVTLDWILPGQQLFEERYYYAAGVGLVQWFKADGKKSWVSEVIRPGSQQNNVREIINC